MSCHANVCTIELCVYASFCYKHISIWRKFARIQFKSNICVSKLVSSLTNVMYIVVSNKASHE